jgi:hypothetical protein
MVPGESPGRRYVLVAFETAVGLASLGMKVHLIQPRELFGPPERQHELRLCWDRNAVAGFDITTHASGQPSFNALLSLCLPDAVNVIANSDIYFERSAVAYFRGIDPGEVWALSRWDITDQGPLLWDHADSQDVWVIHGTPRDIDAPFRIGTPGCDNRLAYLLVDAGYDVRNPSYTVQTYHLHRHPHRSYLVDGRKVERVPGPYHLVRPCAL